MYFLYLVISSLTILISPFIFIYRILKNKENKKSFLEKLCLVKKKKKNKNLIWFHCASVGEILSILPLIRNYEKNKKIGQIIITSSTLSSSKVFNNFRFKKTIHQFYPIDHPLFVNNFLNHWKPSIAIFVESEIWPCMFKKIKDRGIPLILLNARLTKKTFNRWFFIKNFSKSIFKNIKIAYPQNNETINYLKKLELKKIKVIGNLKFSELKDLKKDIIKKNLIHQFKKKKIFIASSTHDNEEVFCARAHKILKSKNKNILTIIIPRHIHRTKDIVLKIRNLNLKVGLHSSNIKNIKNLDIYLVDTFGETKKFHKIASSVFLGGSIINRGGQNPLEAARYGAKILHGPNVDNFLDIYKLLKILKVSKKIKTPKELAQSISFIKNKNIGKKINNIGEKILKKTIKELDSQIYNELKKT